MAYVNKTNSVPSAANPLRSLSPKTIAAIVLMGLMAVLWLRVLTGGQTAPSAALAAEQAMLVATTKPTETSVRIEPAALPILEGRHDRLGVDLFSAANWPDFRAPANAADPVDEHLAQRQRQKALLDSLSQSLHLDAILQAGQNVCPRACIDGKVFSEGQTLTVKKDKEMYELTVSQIDDNRVVLTWDQWSVVLKMAESEDVD